MSLKKTVEAISLIPILELSPAEQLRILAIRNQPEVRRNMYTSHEISEAEHQAWLQKLARDDSTRFFAVSYNQEIVGGVSLNAISAANARADWAYYLDASLQGKGLGSALEYVFLNRVFGEFGLLKLNCEVLSFNEKVISLHQKFGFQIEGVRRQQLRRGTEAFDVHLLGITRDEWHVARERLGRLFT
jgi:UDP-4-amino-4,6-dideoxy-N-acetyl-beta-L-altrosamine N-acetyltransferase